MATPPGGLPVCIFHRSQSGFLRCAAGPAGRIPLAHLVGARFRVGAVELRGIRLVEPCDHLAKLTDRRVLAALVHRGGSRADIVSSGIIRIGDVVDPI